MYLLFFRSHWEIIKEDLLLFKFRHQYISHNLGALSGHEFCKVVLTNDFLELCINYDRND